MPGRPRLPLRNVTIRYHAPYDTLSIAMLRLPEETDSTVPHWLESGDVAAAQILRGQIVDIRPIGDRVCVF